MSKFNSRKFLTSIIVILTATSLRALGLLGEEWWVGTVVPIALGYSVANLWASKGTSNNREVSNEDS